MSPKITRRISVISGDGIGPEVIGEGLKILSKVSRRLKTRLEFKNYDIGAQRYLKTGETLTDKELDSISASDAIYLGAVGDPRVKPGILERDVLLKLRFELDLYINLRPCILMEGAFTPLKDKTPQDINFVVVRENSESVYSGVGGVFRRGTPYETALQEDINTRHGVDRILDYAFKYCAKRKNRKMLTLVDKANVLVHAHGLWRRAFEEMGENYPDIKRHALFVDAAAMDFVRKPEVFDVVVTNNLFGDILTDLGAIVSGGVGMAASANLNDSSISDLPRKGQKCRGLFEPIHGSAPDIAGRGLANPIAAILAAKMMLDSFGETRAASAIEKAVKSTVAHGNIFKKNSADLAVSTSEVGDRVASFITYY
jgi:3-isopropylmalate dehydrogenase